MLFNLQIQKITKANIILTYVDTKQHSTNEYHQLVEIGLYLCILTPGNIAAYQNDLGPVFDYRFKDYLLEPKTS